MVKAAQTNLHAWAHHGLLNKEAGRLPPATATFDAQTSQWTCLLTMQLLEVPSGVVQQMRVSLGAMIKLVVRKKGWLAGSQLSVAGTS
jgi:hypothetical protein